MGSAHEMIKEWRTDVLPRSAKRALDFLSKKRWIGDSQWYLAGGTALALQTGHRQSFDLDFFTRQSGFSFAKLTDRFSNDAWDTTFARDGTVYGKLLGAKVSFIAYPFFIPKEKMERYGYIKILSPRDIAVMKIIAISQRGKKRDFVDLYWYVRREETILEVIRRLPEQYPTVAHDYHHILKSLMYFEDAEEDPMPKLFFTADWKTVKAYFRREIPKITKELWKLR